MFHIKVKTLNGKMEFLHRETGKHNSQVEISGLKNKLSFKK